MSAATCGTEAPDVASLIRVTKVHLFNCQIAELDWPLSLLGRGAARLFPSPQNEGSDAPRRRVVRITPDGPDDHSGRTRIAGSWRISGCAAPTRRATRHLPLSRSRPVGPARGLCAAGRLPECRPGT